MNVPRRHVARIRILVVLAALCSVELRAANTAVPVGIINMTIAETRVVVRETYDIQIASTSDVVLFDQIPVEADASSLMLLDSRGDVKMTGWKQPPDPLMSPAMKAVPSGRGVKIDMGVVDPRSFGPVEANVEASVPGSRRVDLVYCMTGINWEVTYDVLVRGDLASVTNPMSVDVDGWIRIDNKTLHTFSNANITVIGPDTMGEVEAPKEHGILELDDGSPLADMWRRLPPEPRVSRYYSLKAPVTLPAAQAVSVSLVAVSRKPVVRQLVLHAEEVPTDSRNSYAVPSQVITFKNGEDYGGNRAVPPGRALIHVGNQRSTLQQEAWFQHTPAQGNISINLGKVDGVRSRRIHRERTPVIGGGAFDQMYEVRLENRLDQALTIMMDEQPPLAISWTVVRANQPYDLVNHRLLFNPLIKANSDSVIQYTIRYQIPGM